MAMTAVMGRLHARLPEGERYPLPPREISERSLSITHEAAMKDAAMTAHFAYGAASGALLAAIDPKAPPFRGAAEGVAIWAASYFGWIPALRILLPANRHPRRRNALMVAAHLVWGAAHALGYRELVRARTTALRAGPIDDAWEKSR